MTFKIYLQEVEDMSGVCCKLDITTDRGNRVVAVEEVTVDELVHNDNKRSMIFKVESESWYEYRIFGTSNAAINAAYERIAILYHPIVR